MDIEIWISYNFHVLQTLLLLIFLIHLKKKVKTILRLYSNRQQRGPPLVSLNARGGRLPPPVGIKTSPLPQWLLPKTRMGSRRPTPILRIIRGREKSTPSGQHFLLGRPLISPFRVVDKQSLQDTARLRLQRRNTLATPPGPSKSAWRGAAESGRYSPGASSTAPEQSGTGDR